MCCKEEPENDKVPIPLGTGTAYDAADQVEFVRWDDMELTNEAAARGFHQWLRDSVSGQFYDFLVQELNDESKGE